MTALRQRMIEDMQVRNLAPHTQTTYLKEIRRFAHYFGKSPDLLGEKEIRTYQLYLTNQKKLAPSSIAITIAAFRFLYKVTLKRDWDLKDVIPAPRQPKRLPVVLSREEVLHFLGSIEGLKHRTILTTCYAAGLRISEAVSLKPTAIDSRRMVIRVVQGKGRKDRNVMLSPKLLGLLRSYWKAEHPKAWRFPGDLPGQPIGTRAVAKACLTARRRSGISKRIAADPKHLGAEIGFFAVLHTWGQQLLYHPHLHCVVPGGGLSPDGSRWVSCRPGFFLPVRVLARLFRRLFLQYLKTAFDSGRLEFFASLQPLRDRRTFLRFLMPARMTEWVVYAKPPMAGPKQVLEYLGRYTHRVAISNSRIVGIDDGAVRFRWKNYRASGRVKMMTLTADEFIRRFLLHVLPDGFQRIRHYGFLANRSRQQKLDRCRQLLAMAMFPYLTN
jgi:site-specific recombinase XerD